MKLTGMIHELILKILFRMLAINHPDMLKPQNPYLVLLLK